MYDNVRDSLIASSVLSSLALPFFIFRLWIRIRMQRMGWDDVWATAAFVCGTMNVVSGWIYVVRPSDGSSSIAMWIYMFTFTCLLWSVRVSIVFSIIRIIPARDRLHICGLTIVAFFLLICFAFLTMEAILCTYAYHVFQPTPLHPFFLCSTSRASEVAELAVGCIADTVSVVFPLYVLRRANLPSREHRLLRLLFSSSLVVSVACTIRAICRLVPSLSSWSVVISNFQIATCLIVCNLLVIATYLYRVLGYKGHAHDSTSDSTEQDSTVEKDDHSTSSPMSPQMTLTTIDHLFSMSSGASVSAVSDEMISESVNVVDSRSC